MPQAPTPPGHDAVCRHCGTRFRPSGARTEFCCAGCEFVFHLIAKNDLSKFYDLQEGARFPVRSLVFQKRDWSWLETQTRDAEAAAGPGGQATTEMDVQGVSCIGCVWLIERLFQRREGALGLDVDTGTGRLRMRWRAGVFQPVEFARELQAFGYATGPPGAKSAPESRALLPRLGVCAALAMNAMLFALPEYLGMAGAFEFARLFHRVAFGIATLSIIVGGGYFFARTWRSLRSGVLHIDFPISLGLLAAYAGSTFAWATKHPGFLYFDFVSIFAFLMLLGRWVQQKAVERNRHLLLGLREDAPTVTLESTGATATAEALARGERFRVAPGAPVPVRARLESEGATLGMEWISGESEAAAARRGQVVPAGAIVAGREPAAFEALETWKESMLAALLRAAPRTVFRDARLERFIRGYLLVILGLAGAALPAIWLVRGDWGAAWQVAVSILVVSCPCAAGVALPLADDMAAAILRRAGVFVREHSLWARLPAVRKVIFDKTGTVTAGTPELRNPESLASLDASAREALEVLVADSLHPVACALREAGAVSPPPPNGAPSGPTPDVRETPGLGVEWQGPSGRWRLGREAWALNRDPATQPADGGTVLAKDGAVAARFEFEDKPRADAAREVARLRAAGLRVHLFSGDRRDKVAAAAAALGLPDDAWEGEMTPLRKANRLQAMDRQDTLMVGDGANDSLAFNAAWCTATPAIDRGLLERKADFYFLGSGLDGVRRAMEMAERRRRVARRVTAFSITYNAAAVAACFAGWMNPLAAAVIMPLSSLASIGIVLAGYAGAGSAGAGARKKPGRYP